MASEVSVSLRPSGRLCRKTPQRLLLSAVHCDCDDLPETTASEDVPLLAAFFERQSREEATRDLVEVVRAVVKDLPARHPYAGSWQQESAQLLQESHLDERDVPYPFPSIFHGFRWMLRGFSMVFDGFFDGFRSISCLFALRLRQWGRGPGPGRQQRPGELLTPTEFGAVQRSRASRSGWGAPAGRRSTQTAHLGLGAVSKVAQNSS